MARKPYRKARRLAADRRYETLFSDPASAPVAPPLVAEDRVLYALANCQIALSKAGSIGLSLISLRKSLEAGSPDGLLSPSDADNLLNVCQVLGFAEPLVRFVMGEANL